MRLKPLSDYNPSASIVQAITNNFPELCHLLRLMLIFLKFALSAREGLKPHEVLDSSNLRHVIVRADPDGWLGCSIKG